VALPRLPAVEPKGVPMGPTGASVGRAQESPPGMASGAVAGGNRPVGGIGYPKANLW
jgi:hypothetical protein